MSSNIKRRFPDGISISSNNYSTSSRKKFKRQLKKLAPNYILCSMVLSKIRLIGDSI